MIPLKKTRDVKKRYNDWYRKNKEEVGNYFSGYLSGRNSDWIKQKHRNKIKEYLFKTSHQKCAYCERTPNEGGGHLEIEHFYPKKNDEYKHKAFDFDNLLPSCEQCNTVKGTRFKNRCGVEILNPYNENLLTPHLVLNPNTMLLAGKSSKGKATVDILGISLNAGKFPLNGGICRGAIHVRKKILAGIDRKLAVLKEHRDIPGLIYNELKALLDMIREKETCTAARATVLLNHPHFREHMEILKETDTGKYLKLNKLVQSKKRFCFSHSMD